MSLRWIEKFSIKQESIAMIVHPFKALRCTPETAQPIASAPYDIVDTDEARKLAEGNPLSFLHVVRSEIDLPDGTDLYHDSVYAKAAENLKKLREQGALIEEETPSLYALRITMGSHVQTGLYACCSVDDYERSVIKKHELTRKDKEDDRTRHITTMHAQAGPVLLTYQDLPAVDRMLAEVTQSPALLTATSETGVRHEVWRIADPAPVVDAFAGLDVAYVADGHHRSASACRVRSACREKNPGHTGQEEYNFFLTAMFPASQMNILAYNRVVKDLNGKTPQQVLEAARAHFDVAEATSPVPSKTQQCCIYMEGQWYELNVKPEFVDAKDPVKSLDCSLMQDYFIEPILGIKELRTDPRISFVGGSKGTEALEQRVDSGKAAIAFSLYPTTIEQLMAVADADKIMPPKSTWFEPKLRSGLIIHAI